MILLTLSKLFFGFLLNSSFRLTETTNEKVSWTGLKPSLLVSSKEKR